MTADIHYLANQFDRLLPGQVDATLRDWGQGQEAGHVGHEHTDQDQREAGEAMDTVGWYAEAGNVGNPVLRIHPDDVAILYSRLASLPDGAWGEDVSKDDSIFAGLRIEWAV